MKSFIAYCALSLFVGSASNFSFDLEDLERKLKDPNDNVRRDAVTDLAKLGSEEAWSLVFDSLADEAPRVGDAAQMALGNSDDEAVVLELQGKRGVKAKSTMIQGRVLEALGRSPLEIPASAFVKSLASKEEDVRLRAAWSIERLARAGKLGGDPKGKLVKALKKVLDKDKSPDVQAEAFSALFAIDQEEWRTPLHGMLGEKDSQLVVAALQAASHLEPREAEGLAANVRAHKEVRVRRAVVGLLDRIGSKRAVELLIERLEVEEDLRISWSIVEHLQSLSGLKHRKNVRPWKAWFETLDADWVAGDRNKEHEYDEASVAFVGLPVLSQNVALLIDFSGSTWQEREGGVTRKSKLDVEVQRVLEALPETTWFNVIPFATNPIPWEDELVPATKRNVKKALDFFTGCRTSGKGDFLAAALLALEDPRVDTIMVLTDGAPTGGAHWNLQLLVPWLVEKGRYRLVAVDSLLVDTSKGLLRYWEDLAERTGGRSISVDL